LKQRRSSYAAAADIEVAGTEGLCLKEDLANCETGNDCG